MANKVSFTKAILDKLPAPGKGARSYLYDSRVNGLCVSVTPSGTKSFLVYRKLNGRPIRVTLGRYPDLSIEQARKLAAQRLSEIAQGKDPIKEKKAKRNRKVSLMDAFEDYMVARANHHSQNTKSNYWTVMDSHLSDWKRRPLESITRDMVERKHRLISETSPSAANKSMRILRAIFNYAEGKYEDEKGKSLFPDNPVKRLTHTRAWNREQRRQNVIKRSELRPWFDAVNVLRRSTDQFEQIAGDYFIFLLLTGLRRREASTLLIEDVDFKEQTFTVWKTKNKKPITLPMSSQIFTLLNGRCEGRTSGPVFHGPDTDKYINDPRRCMNKVRAISGVEFTFHDLRRTFITIAESLDISAFALKALVNHSAGSDVTAGYVIMDVERLRRPMQQVSGSICEFAERGESKVVTTESFQKR